MGSSPGWVLISGLRFERWMGVADLWVIPLMRGGHRSWDAEGRSEALIRDAESGGAI